MNRRAQWWWLALVAVPLGLGLARLRFDADVLNLLPGDLPVVRGLKLHQQHFADEGELIITVDAPDADAAEAAARQVAEALRRATNLVERVVWRPPWLEHPADTADFIAWLWLNQPPAAWSNLITRLAPENLGSHLQAAREQLAASLSPLEVGRLSFDPLGLTALPEEADTGATGGLGTGEDRFASPDGRFRLLFVTPHADRSGFLAATAWLEEVRELVDMCSSGPGWPGGVKLAYTGKPAFLAEAAGGMQRDMRGSVLGTLAVIAALFWLAHRRWAPLLVLLAALQVVLLVTAALGGLLHGTINLVSFGFAAILLGLSVDYGLVLYQELSDARTLGLAPMSADHELPLTRPSTSVAEIRRRNAPAIWGSAGTTASAFALLNFGGLPGLGQLGSLVAVGVLVAAVVMLYGFLPLAARGLSVDRPPSPRPSPPLGAGERVPDWSAEARRAKVEGRVRGMSGSRPQSAHFPSATVARLVTVLLAAVGGWLLLTRFPALDHGTQPLSPRHSQAEPALRELSRRLGRDEQPVMMLVAGHNEAGVRQRIEAATVSLRAAQAAGVVSGFELPLALWPKPELQRMSLPLARALATQGERIAAGLLTAGFTAEAGALAERVFAWWAAIADGPDAIWPTDPSSRWLVERVAARTPEGWLALGLVYPTRDAVVEDLVPHVEGLTFCGWQLLGEALLGRVQSRVAWLLAGVGGALVLCLWLTFRRWTDVALAFTMLGFGLGLLLAVMAAFGWSWNLMNLTALPLLLGAGVDYAIHVQLSLRRHRGDAAAMRRTTGRALWLCAGTTIAAFGSLALSSNAGLASLGRVCAVGVAAAFVSALYLLPAWRYAAHRSVMDGNTD